MSMRKAVAAPFRGRGADRLRESEFVVALSLDRDWFTPDQAKRLVDLAAGRDLLVREDDHLVPGFDPSAVEVEADFVPDEELLAERSAFELALEALTDDGMEKREAVAAINELQAELALTVEGAAVLSVRRRDLPADAVAERARASLSGGE